MRVLEPSGDVVTLEDGEETRVQKRVHLYVGHRCDGTGMLLVTTRRVVWDPDCQARGLSGFSLFYPAIAMHAVCRDTSDFSQPCIYLQLDPEQNLGELAGVFEQEDASSKRARPESDDPSTEAANAAPMADDEEDSDGGEEEDDDVDQTWQELRLVPATEGGEGNEGANSTGTDAASVPDELDTIYAVSRRIVCGLDRGGLLGRGRACGLALVSAPVGSVRRRSVSVRRSTRIPTTATTRARRTSTARRYSARQRPNSSRCSTATTSFSPKATAATTTPRRTS